MPLRTAAATSSMSVSDDIGALFVDEIDEFRGLIAALRHNGMFGNARCSETRADQDDQNAKQDRTDQRIEERQHG